MKLRTHWIHLKTLHTTKNSISKPEDKAIDRPTEYLNWSSRKKNVKIKIADKRNGEYSQKFNIYVVGVPEGEKGWRGHTQYLKR